jgi:hypothetical protein
MLYILNVQKYTQIAAFRENGCLTSEEVAGMFANSNINYKVNECRLVSYKQSYKIMFATYTCKSIV